MTRGARGGSTKPEATTVLKLAEPVPSVILFERRGEKVGYRVGGELNKEMELNPPELTTTAAALGQELQDLLVRQGLCGDEAHAMVETWRESWFEEGSRVFYIVPRAFVDAKLPTTIHPQPVQTVRVFVGRLEIVTPATEREVAQAMIAQDGATLEKYKRCLEPMMRVVCEKESNAGSWEHLCR